MRLRHLARPFVRFAVAAAVASVCLVGAPSPALAQAAAPLSVDVDWLAAHLNDKGLVLLHVGSQADYDAGHIPGARLLATAAISLPSDPAKGELMLELPPADVLRRNLAALGISDDSRIVVYSGTSVVMQTSTRVVFTLDYLGLGDHTSLLSGGMAGWTAAGHAASTETPAVAAGTLTARPTKDVVADAALVKSLAGRPRYKLVDARAPVYYNGTELGMGVTEKGHIPGAISIPFFAITNNGQVVDRARAAAAFQAAGIEPGDTVVAYCHVGQQATAIVFAARLLGYPAKLYDGSFQEWSGTLHNPVEK